MFSLWDQKENAALVKRVGDNVYYNIVISNTDQETNPTKEPRPAAFLQSVNTPIFSGDPEDWMFSVVSFDVPSQLIPIQIVPLQEGSNTDTTYKVSLTWGAFTETATVQWVPEDQTAPVPAAATPYIDKVMGYSTFLSLYSFRYMVKLINDAFQTAYTAMAAHLGFPATSAPFLTYDSNSLLFAMNASTSYVEGSGIGIWFNEDLMKNFLGTFPVFKEDQGSVSGLDYRFLILDEITNHVVFPAPYGNGLTIKQEVPALPLWYSFASLIMSTGSMPIAREWTATNVDLENNPFVVVLTDFQVPYRTGAELRNVIQYQPTAEYRRMTMPSSMSIQRIDLKLFWRLKTSATFIPVMIPFFNQVNVKMLFEKK